jgi:putative membrane protein
MIGHGTLAGHMLQHLVVMNGAALLLAIVLRPKWRGTLAVSTVLQIALLCFARRPLYAAHGDPGGLSALDDQQLAGLLMMASCAVVYVVAAVVLFVRWMNAIGKTPNKVGGRPWRPADA